MTAGDDARAALARGNDNYGFIQIDADTLRELLDPELDGATDVPTLGAAITTAGEFAATWNALPAEAREMWVSALSATARAAERCFMEGHAATAERIASWCETTAKVHRAEAIDVKRRSPRLDALILASGYNARAAALDDLAARLRDGRLS